jgi:hypothetical protein
VFPVEKAGAYGMIKQHEIIHALPEEENEEFYRLDRRKKRTPAVEKRLEELWAMAIKLHEEEREAEDAEIEANLRALYDDSENPPPTGS